MAFCGQCGKELREGLRFCTACGAPVEAPIDEAPVVNEPATEASVAEAQATEPMTDAPMPTEVLATGAGAMGSGRITLTAFWEQDGHQYATGSFMWPIGETEVIALVRP